MRIAGHPNAPKPRKMKPRVPVKTTPSKTQDRIRVISGNSVRNHSLRKILADSTAQLTLLESDEATAKAVIRANKEREVYIQLEGYRSWIHGTITSVETKEFGLYGPLNVEDIYHDYTSLRKVVVMKQD